MVRLMQWILFKRKGRTYIYKMKSDPITKLPTADNFVLSEDKEEKLSEIIAEINSIAGKSYDNDVAIKAMLQIKDIMMKSEKLKTSAKNNTAKDFEFAYFDDIDDALIEGLEQNPKTSLAYFLVMMKWKKSSWNFLWWNL